MIERVEMARTAVHEEEDHTLRAADTLSGFGARGRRRRRFSRRALRREKAALRQQSIKGERPEAAAGTAEEIAAAGGTFKVLHGRARTVSFHEQEFVRIQQRVA